MKLAFMGTPDFAVPILDALIEAGHDIVAVYSQPPRPAGRGHHERLSPVHAFANARNLPVRTPRSLKGAEEQAAFRDLDLDAAIVAAYGLILPKAILDAPRQGCINVHASLLPRWRGAAPIHRALLAGDHETGITIMQMDEGLDTGAMQSSEAIPIAADATAESLHDRLAALGAKLLVETLPQIEQGVIQPRTQPETGMTYAEKLTKEEGLLDWRLSAEKLERTLRAFTPWPGAWFDFNGQRFKILEGAVEKGQADSSPGLLLDDRLLVACGDGTALRLLKIQRAGKAALDADAFLRGYAIKAGQSLCPASD